MNNEIKLEYNKRYESMINSDLGMTTKDFHHFDVINFDNDEIYNVELKSKTKVRCNCPDYTCRGYQLGVPCKHILFVLSKYDEYQSMANTICKDILSRFNKYN